MTTTVSDFDLRELTADSLYYVTPLHSPVFTYKHREAVRKNFFGVHAMVSRNEELVIIAKMYDLMKWCCEHTSKFPRNYRFVLGERIEKNMLDVLEWLIDAKFSKNQIEVLTRINLKLEILRHQLRLAKDLQCLRVNSYLYSCKSVDEIGRLLGAWLKTARATP